MRCDYCLLFLHRYNIILLLYFNSNKIVILHRECTQINNYNRIPNLTVLLSGILNIQIHKNDLLMILKIEHSIFFFYQ